MTWWMIIFNKIQILFDWNLPTDQFVDDELTSNDDDDDDDDDEWNENKRSIIPNSHGMFGSTQEDLISIDLKCIENDEWHQQIIRHSRLSFVSFSWKNKITEKNRKIISCP